MFKSKARKELESNADKLWVLNQTIREIQQWCAYDSPEIAFAMQALLELDTKGLRVDAFRDKLRRGEFTFDNFVKRNRQ